MEHTALYRKYRPQKFSEVLGQDHVVKVLESSIDAEKVSHAYLFVGSRGTGKTSAARILASEIGVSANDLYEMDAASNRGIDDIKTLRDGVLALPFDSKYKVYIIDEAHMLSKDAWGALLKTLEEPPKHVIFILATTEFHKVPDTIISRCQVFTFKKPNEQIIKKMLAAVAKSEGKELEEDAAELLAILADGSFRDALGELQKILNFTKGKKIKREEVEKISGAPKSELVDYFINAIADRDLDKGIAAVERAASENLDMKLYHKLIIERAREIVILRQGPLKSEMFNSRTLAALLEAYQNIDRAFIPQLPLELALVKILRQDK